MCKKQRYFIKTKTGALLLFISLFAGVLIPAGVSAQISNALDSIEDQLNRAVVERDFDTLWTLRNHPDGSISYRASMALIHSDPVHIDWLFEQVIRSKSIRDWIILSHADLNSDHLGALQNLASAQEIAIESACEVFYRQGSQDNLHFLLRESTAGATGERCAMAIGGLFAKFEVSEIELGQLMDLYEGSENESVRRNLLYGFFRSELNRPATNSPGYNRMKELFEKHTRLKPLSLLDQYFVRALGAGGVQIAINSRSGEEIEKDVQFAVELARASSTATDQESLMNFTESLILHPNHHVAIQLMESLGVSEYITADFIPVLKAKLNPEPDNPGIFLSYLDLLVHLDQDISEHKEDLFSISDQHPYLVNRVYSLLEDVLDENEFINLLIGNLPKEGIRSYRAAEALGIFPDYDSINGENRRKIKQAILDQIQLKNRSVLSPSLQVLTGTGLEEQEKEQLKKLYLNEYDKPESGFAEELYHLLSEISPEHIENLPEPHLKPFREPDMNQMAGPGLNPVWILETNLGEIQILLYPQEAPFTVSSIVHLTNNGVYNDVAFHRVVRNFVIQGGDFDRRDGFGGPSYRIPTEPSIESFTRGKVGIASSGQDTEGSQFFITHTWTPHLDGLYTIFGEVIRGMEIVDRIQTGDRVIRARVQ